MFCLHFDPEEGRYTPFATNLMKLAGSLTVLVAAIFIVPYWFMRPGTKREPAKNPYQEQPASPPPDDAGS
jgi:hypothetical protein